MATCTLIISDLPDNPVGVDISWVIDGTDTVDTAAKAMMWQVKEFLKENYGSKES